MPSIDLLAFSADPGLTPLEIASGKIVEDGEAENIIPRLSLADIPALLSNKEPELQLEIHLFGKWRPNDLSLMSNNVMAIARMKTRKFVIVGWKRQLAFPAKLFECGFRIRLLGCQAPMSSRLGVDVVFGKTGPVTDGFRLGNRRH